MFIEPFLSLFYTTLYIVSCMISEKSTKQYGIIEGKLKIQEIEKNNEFKRATKRLLIYTCFLRVARFISKDFHEPGRVRVSVCVFVLDLDYSS